MSPSVVLHAGRKESQSSSPMAGAAIPVTVAAMVTEVITQRHDRCIPLPALPVEKPQKCLLNPAAIDRCIVQIATARQTRYENTSLYFIITGRAVLSNLIVLCGLFYFGIFLRLSAVLVSVIFNHAADFLLLKGSPVPHSYVYR